MKAQTFAPLAFMAAVEASRLIGRDYNVPRDLFDNDLLDLDILNNNHGPKEGPCDDCIDTWHPAHPGVEIDDCDDLEEEDWHYVHPITEPHTTYKPHTWGTSTITYAQTTTYHGCPPSVKDCPDRDVVYTSVTHVESTTICPVEVTKPPKVVETSTEAYHPPIKTTTIVPEVTHAPATTLVPHPPKKPTVQAPPAVKTSTITANTPCPEVPEVHEAPSAPAAQAPSYVPAPEAAPSVAAPAPIATPAAPIVIPDSPAVSPPNNSTAMTPTAGAAQNAQNLGLALAGLIAAALL